MEGKLIKTENGYGLKDCELIAFVSSRRPEHKHRKLSLTNCQAIERGYDLDELVAKKINDFNIVDKAVEFSNAHPENNGAYIAYIAGASEIVKTLELMGDKKFSEQDMYKMFIYGRSIDTAKKHVKELEDKPIDEFFNDFIQSLQQTEWDVEIEMECCGNYTKPCNLNCEYGPKSKLDADGCLILKRK